MSMEMNGLAMIAANSTTLHGLAMPPEPKDYATGEAYERAYDAWWTRTHCWRASVTEGER